MGASNSDEKTWFYGSAVLGCGNFGGIGGNLDFVGKGMDEATSFAAMDEAAALGITLFDTAERYAAGECERIVGRWLNSRPDEITESIHISTKVGPPWLDGRAGRFDRSYIESTFSGSLDRLGVEAVDVLYTHAPDNHAAIPDGYEPTPIETTLEALESVRESGRTRLVGASNIDGDRLATAIEAADRMGVAGYQVIQNGFNLLGPAGDAEVRSIAKERGIVYTAYSALASGVLTGKYRRGESPPVGSLLDIGYLDEVPAEVLDAVDRLASVAAERGTQTGALALAWLMAHPDVAAITTAPSRRPPHLALLTDAITLKVTDGEFGDWSAWFDSAAQKS
ncbi:MAG: aldo/keto reductase [Acidimicrobiia bacterium]